MRYFFDTSSLFICGAFRAASTGISGGIRSVSTLINHTVSPVWNHEDPKKELEFVAAGAGFGQDFFGLLTAVPVQHCCVLQYDSVTAFITAGIRREPPANAGTINIILCSREGLGDAALLESIMVASEAKAEALQGMGLPLTGTPTDAIITGCEGEVKHHYAGRLTDTGLRIREAVLYGIPQAIARHDSGVQYDHAPFFIFSRFQGDHWVEWSPHDCPYFPCHYAGQRCDFCYCPFYPCRDNDLGEWAESSHGGRVWNCAGCTLLHESGIADYLKKFPGASLTELKCLRKNKKEVL
jgi:adenosylcobinamide hydrolase